MTQSPKNVLIVEDESAIVFILEAFLEVLGHRVAGVASRLEDGLRQAATADVDIALLDINLAGQLSYPIAALLRRRGIPFVFATGYGAAGLPPEFRTAPVLAKPFSERDLARVIG